ncbi:hypothetical protein JCM16814_18510 [Desulfobaculum senezii]
MWALREGEKCGAEVVRGHWVWGVVVGVSGLIGGCGAFWVQGALLCARGGPWGGALYVCYLRWFKDFMLKNPFIGEGGSWSGVSFWCGQCDWEGMVFAGDSGLCLWGWIVQW